MPPASGPDVRHGLFRRRVDAWLEADLDAYMDCWADDMVIDLPSGRIVGKERYRKLVQAGFGWAAPVAFDVHHIATVDWATVDGGDVVLADWTIRARRRDDGIVVGWHGLSVCEFRAGKIAWWREHHLAPPAPLEVLQETQAEPTEGEA
ncbi:MAG: nuclear transport factor 2 family protein [Actinomycetota bacterium]|nr:nuclear transport factor 2 family protein [Actinomycetota bacterium]